MSSIVAFDLTASLLPGLAAPDREALKRAGFKAVTCEIEHVERMLSVIGADVALPLIAIGAELDVRGGDVTGPLIAAMDRLAKSAAAPMVLLRLRSSDGHDAPGAPRAMPHAAAAVTQLARRIAAALPSTKIALEGRAGYWMQELEDAVRVAMRVNRPNVGVAFGHGQGFTGSCSKSPRKSLRDALVLALPKLLAVIVSRTQIDDVTGVAPLIEELRALGYAGPIILRPTGHEQSRDA